MSKHGWDAGIAVCTGETWCVVEDVDGLRSVPLAVGSTHELAWTAFEAVMLAEMRADGEVTCAAGEAEFLDILRERTDQFSVVRSAIRVAFHIDERCDLAPSMHCLDSEEGECSGSDGAAEALAIVSQLQKQARESNGDIRTHDDIRAAEREDCVGVGVVAAMLERVEREMNALQNDGPAVVALAAERAALVRVMNAIRARHSARADKA